MHRYININKQQNYHTKLVKTSTLLNIDVFLDLGGRFTVVIRTFRFMYVSGMTLGIDSAQQSMGEVVA